MIHRVYYINLFAALLCALGLGAAAASGDVIFMIVDAVLMIVNVFVFISFYEVSFKR